MPVKLIEGQKLYHGSNVVVIAPDLSYSRAEVDFGPGFYCTVFEQQARKWAKGKTVSSLNDSHYVVSEYTLGNIETLDVLEFTEPDISWFKAVIRGRKGFPANADIVIGPVADSSIREILVDTEERISSLQKHLYDYPSLSEYREAERDIYRQAAASAVPPQFRNDNQTVFVTEKGLQHITFCRAFVYDSSGCRTGVYDRNGRYYPYSRTEGRTLPKGDDDVRRH